jgi:hypothetical protein
MKALAANGIDRRPIHPIKPVPVKPGPQSAIESPARPIHEPAWNRYPVKARQQGPGQVQSDAVTGARRGATGARPLPDGASGAVELGRKALPGTKRHSGPTAVTTKSRTAPNVQVQRPAGKKVAPLDVKAHAGDRSPAAVDATSTRISKPIADALRGPQALAPLNREATPLGAKVPTTPESPVQRAWEWAEERAEDIGDVTVEPYIEFSRSVGDWIADRTSDIVDFVEQHPEVLLQRVDSH